MVQKLLLEMGRANPLISILERGDSYRPLIELMGGRVVEVDLDGAEALNPWDLPVGQRAPSKEKIAFLQNLTRHMIGDLGQTDTSLLDNILSEAIAKVYKRAAVRADNKTPTYIDLRNELSTWTDEERIEHIRQLAQLAVVTLPIQDQHRLAESLEYAQEMKDEMRLARAGHADAQHMAQPLRLP